MLVDYSAKQTQDGATISNNYDLAGRMDQPQTIALPPNSPSGTIADTDTFHFRSRWPNVNRSFRGRYSKHGPLTRFDPAGSQSERGTDDCQPDIHYGKQKYNARNELVKYTYPDGSISNRAYTARGALSETENWIVSVIDTRSYDSGGRMTSEVLGQTVSRKTRAYRTGQSSVDDFVQQYQHWET